MVSKITCFNAFCKDHVNIHAALNQYSNLIELPQSVLNYQWTTYLSLTLPLTVIKGKELQKWEMKTKWEIVELSVLSSWKEMVKGEIEERKKKEFKKRKKR